jgi:hypothetical protein
VLDHLCQRGELTGVHVGRPFGHVAQAWSSEGCKLAWVVGGREVKLAALLRLQVAVPTQAIEFILQQLLLALGAAAVRIGRVHGRNTSVVECVAGQHRAVVACDALPLSEKSHSPRTSCWERACWPVPSPVTVACAYLSKRDSP